ncbi:hypothetical protein LTR16_006632, partial [Cryomyces antarcticus]
MEASLLHLRRLTGPTGTARPSVSTAVFEGSQKADLGAEAFDNAGVPSGRDGFADRCLCEKDKTAIGGGTWRGSDNNVCVYVYVWLWVKRVKRVKRLKRQESA